jgi:hypothetical protein
VPSVASVPRPHCPVASAQSSAKSAKGLVASSISELAKKRRVRRDRNQKDAYNAEKMERKMGKEKFSENPKIKVTENDGIKIKRMCVGSDVAQRRNPKGLRSEGKNLCADL